METFKDIALGCLYLSGAIVLPVWMGWTIGTSRGQFALVRRQCAAKERENELRALELETGEDGDEWKYGRSNN